MCAVYNLYEIATVAVRGRERVRHSVSPTVKSIMAKKKLGEKKREM